MSVFISLEYQREPETQRLRESTIFRTQVCHQLAKQTQARASQMSAWVACAVSTRMLHTSIARARACDRIIWHALRVNFYLLFPAALEENHSRTSPGCNREETLSSQSDW